MTRTLPCAYCGQQPTVFFGCNSTVLVMCKPCTFPVGNGRSGGATNIDKAMSAWNTVVREEHGDCDICGAVGDAPCKVPEDCKNERTK